MSQFENIIPEPEKLFLIQILKDDELSGELLCSGQFGESVKRMYWIVLRLFNLLKKKEAEPLLNKLQGYMDRTSFSPNDVYKLRRELSALLTDTIYSKLNLGIIPTSTLPGDKDNPEDKPISSELSSRL